MRRNETRLDRLVAARQEQDAARVKETIAAFLEAMPPAELAECREPDALRPYLADFLATQPARIINTIERWAKAKKGGQ